MSALATLPAADVVRLAELEAIVDRGVQTFVEVGNALSEIRDGRLYRARHGTFEAYCRDRWHFTASRARQFISAADVAGELESVTQVTLPSERHARELAPYIASHGVAAAGELWDRLAADGAPTVAALHVAVAGPPAAPFSPWEQGMADIRAFVQLCTDCGAAEAAGRHAEANALFDEAVRSELAEKSTATLVATFVERMCAHPDVGTWLRNLMQFTESGRRPLDVALFAREQLAATATRRADEAFHTLAPEWQEILGTARGNPALMAAFVAMIDARVSELKTGAEGLLATAHDEAIRAGAREAAE